MTRGPVEKKIDGTIQKLVGIKVSQDGTTAMLFAVLANQKYLAQALDLIGSQSVSYWEDQNQ